MVKDNTYHL